MRDRHSSWCAPRRRALHSLIALTLALMALLPMAQAADAQALRPGSASLRTLDLGPTVRWYETHLGFRQVSVDSRVQARRVVLERQGFLLEIAEDHKATPQAGAADVDTTSATGVPVVSLLVPDVDREVRRLRGSGVEIVRDPEDDLDGSFRSALISDYGHRTVELREPLGSPGSFHPTGR
ncbi:VOC family protein [Microvirga pudoricolor]|uniref:VOC family protein n=1 Tax=Microvirga pudoricolor TaxID=2778729 RepID=UPI0019526AD2|nr:VOC family protein [Microvirga pudoricolor]MBM6596593.1 VOC family protein [Microvirga pudoricolor]